MKTVQLAFLPEDGADWRVMTVARAPARSPQCILVVPGHGVLAREIDVMGATAAQSRAAALAALAPELAASTEQSVCSLGTAKSGRQLAIVASRSRIDAWMDMARKAGLTPDMIVPDFLLLPAPVAGEAHIVREDDAIVRTPAGGFACQPEFLPTLLGALKPVEIDLDRAGMDAVRTGAVGEAPNLLVSRRGGATTTGPRKLILAAGSIAAALVIAAVTPWVVAFRTDSATAALRTQSEAVARAALPGARQIVDALAQLREASLPRLRAQAGLERAAGLLEGLAKAPALELSHLELTEDGGARALLAAADVSQLQPLRDHLASLGLHSTETPGESRPNHLAIEFHVSDAP